MKEWSNPWNPFNSAKVLLWREHLEACAKEDYLPPVAVDIDPSNRCPLNCYFCNAKKMIRDSGADMSEKQMIRIADFLAYWRDTTRHKTPNGACIAGGGESFMNPNLVSLYERMYYHGMEIGIITSGYIMRKEHLDIIPRVARWIGFSVDAATSETYKKIKGIKNNDGFRKVIENIKAVVKANNDYTGPRISVGCDVAFKFLLTPENALEIYDAIKLAKEIGVKDFHLRPAGWDNLANVDYKPDWTGLPEKIDKQIEEGMKLQTKNFRVYGIRHKFNPDFSRKISFSRCWAIPLLPTFGADGNLHLCFDRRGDKDLILCKHDPNPYEVLKVWNTDFHREMIRKINPAKDCPRCTYAPVNEIIEQVILKDSMCHKIP